MTDEIKQYFSYLGNITHSVLVDTSTGLRLSGQDLVGLVDKTAAFLKCQKLAQDDTFICIADNNIETALLILASMRHGFHACIVPPSFEDKDITYWKKKLCISTVVDTQTKNSSANKNVSTVDFNLEYLSGFQQVFPKKSNVVSPTMITFTSGTTGASKAIFHRATTFINCAQRFNDLVQISGKDSFLNFMPMHYMAGIFNGLIAPLETGACVVITPSFNIKTILDFHPVVNKYKITSMWMSPSMLAMMVKLDRGRENLSMSLKNIFVGTGLLNKELANQFYSLYGLAPLQSYGLSEVLYVSIDSKDSWMAGTCGTPITGVDVSVSESGTAVIRSPYRCIGWMEDGEFTNSPIYLTTNDLAEFEVGGRLKILGRQDEMIIRGGVNVSPDAIEQKIKSILRTEFCVFGYPHSDLGNCIVLAVVGLKSDKGELKLKCDEKIKSLGKLSIDFVINVNSIPKTVTGKIKRKSLRDQNSDVLGQI